MKSMLVSAVLTALVASPLLAQAERAPESPAAYAALAQQTVINQNVAQRLAMIRSRTDLANYLASTRNQRTPLGMLSPVARRVFTDSLTFNENGLTGFNYKVLEAELTPSQAYQLLSLFGAQRLASMLKNARVETQTDKLIIGMGSTYSPHLINDHEGYACIGRATCGRNMDDICMSGC